MKDGGQGNRTMEEVIKIHTGHEKDDMGYCKECHDTAQALKDAGYLHKSEIRFPGEKQEVWEGKLCVLSSGEVNQWNQSISETKKLNGVE